MSESPFVVNAALSEWNSVGGAPLRAGVSSFGIGGTNAHVVLEEAPVCVESEASAVPALLVVSARSTAALDKAWTRLGEHLASHPQQQSLSDVAYTLQVGRRQFSHRRALLCSDITHTVPMLRAGEPEGETRDKAGTRARRPARQLSAVWEGTPRPVAFLFPGQGSQHINMGVGLYRTDTLFRSTVDECAELLRPALGLDIREVIYPRVGDNEAAHEQLQQTWLTQPALFIVEYALSQWWKKWGVLPAAMIGHSVGEYVAACVAGVMELNAALALVAVRGKLMTESGAGAMVAVMESDRWVAQLLAEAKELGVNALEIAAVNTAQQCVVSGEAEPIAELERILWDRGVGSKRLAVNHAFHSRKMDSVLERFGEEVRKVKLSEPQIRYISNVTGEWVRAEDVTSWQYWVRQMRERVKFSAGVQQLTKQEGMVMVEVGPGDGLSRMVRESERLGRGGAQAAVRETRERKKMETPERGWARKEERTQK